MTDRLLGPRLGGLELPHANRQLALGRVAVGDHGLLTLPLAIDELDHAPVDESGDRGVGDVVERLLIVERGDQQPAGLRQDARMDLGGLHGGDVLDHRHRGDRLALGVAQRRGLEQLPACFAGQLVDAVDQQRRRIWLSAQQPDRRDVIHRHRAAVLVVDHVVGHDGVEPVAPQILERLEAEAAQRRSVGVDDLAVGVADGERLPEGLHEVGEFRPLPPEDLLAE